MITRISKDQHSKHGTCKRDRGHIGLGRRIRVGIWVDPFENGIHRTDNLELVEFLVRKVAYIERAYVVEIAVAEESRTASNDGPQTFPFAFLRASNAAATHWSRRADLTIANRHRIRVSRLLVVFRHSH